MTTRHPRILKTNHQIHSPFGNDAFGRRAEAFARFFGTPRFLIGQTVVVAIWIVMNAAAVAFRWDPYPFILLNLAFSLQAAYAAPLILLAQTRQADRDKATAEIDMKHRETIAEEALEQQADSTRRTAELRDLINLNTELCERIERLAFEVHQHLLGPHR